MSASQTGVCPLVCVVCEQAVGVINAPALAALLDSGEAYICTACAKLIANNDDAGIAAYLELCPPSYYGNLVNCIIAETVR